MAISLVLKLTAEAEAEAENEEDVNRIFVLDLTEELKRGWGRGKGALKCAMVEGVKQGDELNSKRRISRKK